MSTSFRDFRQLIGRSLVADDRVDPTVTEFDTDSTPNTLESPSAFQNFGTITITGHVWRSECEAFSLAAGLHADQSLIVLHFESLRDVQTALSRRFPVSPMTRRHTLEAGLLLAQEEVCLRIDNGSRL